MTTLSGIGPQLGRLVERVAGPLIVDLLWHLPTGIVDRRAAPSVTELEDGGIVTLKLKVERHDPGMGRRPYRIVCYDGTGFITLVYFNVKSDYLQRLLPVGAERIVSGKVEFYVGIPQIAHPDHVVPLDQAGNVSKRATTGAGLCRNFGHHFHLLYLARADHVFQRPL